MMKGEVIIIPDERVQGKILIVRGLKVLLDWDLAELYQVETRTLVQAVRRNIDRFPSDFMFQLSNQELTSLRSQFVISKTDDSDPRGGRRYAPYVFTEHGVAMLSSVLRSKRAVQVSIQIVRSFIKLRELLLSNEALAKRMAKIEQKADSHEKAIISILRVLEEPAISKKRRIGF